MDWTWSSETPEEEGYYWYRDQYIYDIVRIYDTYDEDELMVTGTVLHERQPISNLSGQWAGPIPRPTD